MGLWRGRHAVSDAEYAAMQAAKPSAEEVIEAHALAAMRVVRDGLNQYRTHPRRQAMGLLRDAMLDTHIELKRGLDEAERIRRENAR